MILNPKLISVRVILTLTLAILSVSCLSVSANAFPDYDSNFSKISAVATGTTSVEITAVMPFTYPDNGLYVLIGQPNETNPRKIVSTRLGWATPGNPVNTGVTYHVGIAVPTIRIGDLQPNTTYSYQLCTEGRSCSEPHEVTTPPELLI